jgi:hypothetical protein
MPRRPLFDLGSLVNAAVAGTRFAQAMPQGGMQVIFADAQRLASELMNAAVDRWIPFYASQHPCHVRTLQAGVPFPCAGHAVLLCDACGNPACVSHVRVDASGSGTCFPCIAELIALKRAKGPARGATGSPPFGGAQDVRATRAELRKKALKDLGLGEHASWEEVQKAHRRRAAKYHPDAQKTPSAKARNAEKAVRVNAAYAALKQLFESEVAA